MKVPTVQRAEAMLQEAAAMNPGLWVGHCESAGQSARLIAQRCAGMDPEAAWAMGMLHDIGRRYGFSHMKHILDGYRFMMEQGYDDVAAICLTHSFQYQKITSYNGDVDIPDADFAFVKDFVENREYTEYDRLIQLCDAVSLAGGGILIEKRLLGVAMRYGPNEAMLPKWRATLDLKKHFDERAGINIYKLLPNIIDNTFEW